MVKCVMAGQGFVRYGEKDIPGSFALLIEQHVQQASCTWRTLPVMKMAEYRSAEM